MKKILTAFLFVLTLIPTTFAASSANDLISDINTELSKYTTSISSRVDAKITQFVAESLKRDSDVKYSGTTYYSEPARIEYLIYLDFPNFTQSNYEKRCDDINSVVCSNTQTDGCLVNNFHNIGATGVGCVLNILRSSNNASGGTRAEKVETSDPQDQYRDDISVTGTIYMPGSGFERFEHRVRIDYIAGDGTVKQTYFATPMSPHFGFSVPQDADGQVTFTIIRDGVSSAESAILDQYDDPLPVSIADYKSGRAKGVIRVRNRVSSGSSTRTSGSSSTSSSNTSSTTPKTAASNSASATTARTASNTGNNNSTTTPSGNLKIMGKIIEGDSKDPAIGAFIKPRGTKETALNSATTEVDGTFSILEFPKNTDAEVTYMGYKTQIVSASQLNNGIVITLQPDTTALAAAAVTADCKPEPKQHATKGRYKVTGKRGQDGDKGICIPTDCETDYLLEKGGTDNAVCTPCTDKVPDSATATVVDGKCVATSCKKGLLENGACSSCDGKVPFASRTKVENGKCIPIDCINHFTVENGICVVKCADYKSKLNATAVARKAVGPTTTESDYSKYCYATACDTTKFSLEGTGENQYCKSKAGLPCDAPNASAATLDEKGNCIPQKCNENYKKVGNECKDQRGKSCKDYIKTFDSNATDGKITTFLDDHATACESTACVAGYSVVNGKCEQVCDDATTKALMDAGANATKIDNGKCVASSCKCHYTLSNGTCKMWQDPKPCTKTEKPTLPNHAVVGHVKCNADDEPAYCEIQENGCELGYEKQDNNCIKIVGKECHLDDPLVHKAKMEIVGKEVKCVIKDCVDGYDVQDGKCVPEDQHGKKCPTDKLPAYAKAGKIIDQQEATVTACSVTKCENGYTKAKETAGAEYYTKCIPDCKCGEELVDEVSCQEKTDKACTVQNARLAELTCVNGKEVCKIKDDSCEDGFKANAAMTKCESTKGDPCTIDDNGTNNATQVKTARLELRNGKMECIVKSCNGTFKPSADEHGCVDTQCECGYEWDKGSKSCVAWKDTTCKASHATKTKRTCDENKNEICLVEECDSAKGYVLNPETKACDSVKNDPCTAEQLATIEHASAGKQSIKDGKIVCTATECDANYELAGGACTPKKILTKEQYQQEIAELGENAQKMREKETSLENRIIGAAGIGGTGIGGMMVGSALSERASDAAAEREMAAYLQSIKCDYGNGTNVKGGEVNVELPGGNDMFALYQEYAQLANDLKIRKEALGMRPGIESEVVIDKAETGLYEYTPDGITGGSYASIARALLDPEGEDAQRWAAQKAATDAKLKTGAIVAGVSAVGSGVANYVVNHNNPNKVKDIVNHFNQLRHPIPAVQTLQDSINNSEPQDPQCPSGITTGTYPDCECTSAAPQVFNPERLTCEPCPDPANQTIVNNTCTCPTEKPWNEEKQACAEVVQQEAPCTPQCTPAPGNHWVLYQNCTCSCSDGFTPDGNKCVCKQPKEERPDSNGSIICADPVVTPQSTVTTITTVTDQVNLAGKALFDLDKATIRPDAKTSLDKFVSDLQKAEDYKNCTLVLDGYADPVGNDKHNLDLSKQRVEAVKQYLISKGITSKLKNQNNASITTEGHGEAGCTCFEDKMIEACKNKQVGDTVSGNETYSPCRRVKLTITCETTRVSTSQVVNAISSLSTLAK